MACSWTWSCEKCVCGVNRTCVKRLNPDYISLSRSSQCTGRRLLYRHEWNRTEREGETGVIYAALEEMIDRVDKGGRVREREADRQHTGSVLKCMQSSELRQDTESMSKTMTQPVGLSEPNECSVVSMTLVHVTRCPDAKTHLHGENGYAWEFFIIDGFQ